MIYFHILSLVKLKRIRFWTRMNVPRKHGLRLGTADCAPVDLTNASALLINLLRATPSLDPDLVESEQAEHPNQTLHPSIGLFRRILDR